MFDDEELRRSYSICAGKDEGFLQVGIKRVEGGAFSTWANEELKAGEVLEAMPPMGRFFTPIEPDAAKTYLGSAGGSGITPVLSIIKTVLAKEPKSTFTLVYANRRVNTIMFREEIEDLKNRFLGRFSVVHVLNSEAQDIDLFTGELTAEKCAALFRSWIDLRAVDVAFICGPEPMMLTIAASLKEHGLTEDQIKFELFASGQPGRVKKREVRADTASGSATTEATITLDGGTHTIQMPKQGMSILDAALESHIDAPYACKAGVCSTCRAKVLEVRPRWSSTTGSRITRSTGATSLPASASRSATRWWSPTTSEGGKVVRHRHHADRGIPGQRRIPHVPGNVPAQYRGELLRLMATFVDSEVAASAGFAETINEAPGLTARIAAARITLEKIDHAERVLKLMGDFGADEGRYAVHHPWADRLPETPIWVRPDTARIFAWRSSTTRWRVGSTPSS